MNTTERKTKRENLTYAVEYDVYYYDDNAELIEVVNYTGAIQDVLYRIHLVLSDKYYHIKGAVSAEVSFNGARFLRLGVIGSAK